ncbi:MAG: DnaJ domain-containing protein [Caldilineaceae bacterium]
MLQKMKNYYRILDLPENATLAQIKWQYKQLVRVYHPDRFKDPTDKSFAENKLKEIIEAYRILSSRPEQATGAYNSDGNWGAEDPSMHPPRPIVSHSFLDFGLLKRGESETITIQIGNMGGVAQQLNFVLSEPSEWFAISEQKQLYQDKLLPIEVDVTVDANKLEVGKMYDGWIDVTLDNTTTRVNIAAQIGAKKSRLSFSMRLIMFLGLLLAVSSVAGFLTTSFFSNASSLNEGSSSLSSGLPATQSEPYIVFAAHEGNEQAIFATQISTGKQFKLNEVGDEPTWSPPRRQIAYIDADADGHTQLFLAEIHNLYPAQQSESPSKEPVVISPTQLTQSGEQKSFPVWSPNGRRIAYITHPSADPINQTGSLSMIELDSRKEVALTAAKDGNVTHFSWTANSDSILVSLYKNKVTELSVIDVTSGKMTPLADSSAFIGIEPNEATWLPDDSGVLLSATQGLFQLDLESEKTSQISDLVALKPIVSPNNQKVAFLSPEASNTGVTNLWVVDIDGQNLEQITESGCLSYSWSPDGLYIAFTTGNLESDSPTLYLWIMQLGKEPKVVAEISNPTVSWLY